MTKPHGRPLLVLDVDGPLNPWRAKPTRRPPGYETFRLHPRGWDAAARGLGSHAQRRGLRVWLNPRHGELLVKLALATGGELVWATTWFDQANELIAPLIELPELPVIWWDPSDAPHWKYDAVLTHAGDRPLVWFDDDFDAYPTSRDRFITQRQPLPTLLRHVDPAVGLTLGDVTIARRFLTDYRDDARREGE